RVFCSVAKPCSLRFNRAVATRSAEPEIKRASHCRFGPAGIRRKMKPRVTHHDAKTARGVSVACGGSNDKKPGDASRNEVEKIVQPRRRLAEIFISFVPV